VPDRVPRLRRAPLPDDVVALVRGDTGEANQDRLDAMSFRRRFPDWPAFGVSAFYAVTEEGIDDLGGDMLRRSPRSGSMTRWSCGGPSWTCCRPSVARTSRSASPTSSTGLSVLASSFRERRINPYQEA